MQTKMRTIDGVQFIRSTHEIQTSIVARRRLIPFQGKGPSFPRCVQQVHGKDIGQTSGRKARHYQA